MSETTPALNFAALLTYRFHLLTRLTERTLEGELIEACGLRLLESRIIGIVGSRGPTNMSGLCAAAHFDASQASRLVARMAGRGLVETRVDAEDRRAAVVHLTAEGARMYPRIYETAAAFNTRWMRALSDPQRDLLSQCLTALDEQAAVIGGRDVSLAPPAKPAAPSAPRSATLEVDADAALALYDALGAALEADGRLDRPRRRRAAKPAA